MYHYASLCLPVLSACIPFLFASVCRSWLAALDLGQNWRQSILILDDLVLIIAVFSITTFCTHPLLPIVRRLLYPRRSRSALTAGVYLTLTVHASPI